MKDKRILSTGTLWSLVTIGVCLSAYAFATIGGFGELPTSKASDAKTAIRRESKPTKLNFFGAEADNAKRLAADHNAKMERLKRENEALAAQPADPRVTDEIAAGVLFRFLSPTGEKSETATRNWIEQATKIKSAGAQNAIIELSRDYSGKANALLLRAKTVRDSAAADKAAQLQAIQAEKLALVRGRLTLLATRLGSTDFKLFKTALTEKVKRKISFEKGKPKS